MRKLHTVLLSAFGIGVLLGGIGTGIAIGEYSSLTYKGRVLIGEENLVTKEFDYNFTEENAESVQLSYCNWGDGSLDSLLVEDDTVPAGTVRYVVTYNEEVVRPKLINWKQERDDEGWKSVEKFYDEEEARGEKAQERATEADADTDEELDAGRRKEPERRVVLELRNRWIGNEFDVIMRNKDQILRDLKQKKIASYEIAEITEVEIHVNPASLSYIDDLTR